MFSTINVVLSGAEFEISLEATLLNIKLLACKQRLLLPQQNVLMKIN